MAEQEDDEVGESDARLLFMFQFLSKSMRFKVDKWHKMMATEENKILVMEFLTRPEPVRLIFILSYTGHLCPSDQFPTNAKNKACFFLKKEPVPVTVDNMKSMFIFGDISPKPLDQLAVLIEEVVLPVLTSGNNRISWPKTVAEDVKKRVLDMKDVVFRVKGEVYGRTLLPLPQGIERVHEEYAHLVEGSAKTCDMELRCTLESAVLRWSNQLNEVLKQSSASVFESETNPVPDAEVNFWSQRAKNLCGIYEQLRDPRVKKMATILEKTESAYFPCFQKMFKNVVSAMNEAEEIDRYLRVIVPYIEDIQSTPFVEVEFTFMPLVHNIGLIWVHCTYFQTSTKLVILLKEICNLLMQEANKLLDPNSLFECEIEETLPKTRKVLRNLGMFRKIVLMYLEKIVSLFPPGKKPVPWTFDESLVFERYDKYINRLKLIKELFVTTMEYMKLEKVEVGGNKAHALSLRLNELFENFNNLTASFSSLPYDPTNIDDESFMEDYQRFKATIDDCDRRLAAVACMAFDDCTNFEQIFKMMNIFGGLLVRPVIKKEIEPKYENIITLFEKEVNKIQKIYDLQITKYNLHGLMDVPPNWPPVAGAVLWTESLKKRLLFPLDNINTFGHEVTKTDRAENVKENAKNLIRTLDIFQAQVFSKWKKEVPSDIEHYLKESLLIVFNNKLIELNFHRQLVTALKEVRYLKLLDVDDLPPEALALFERNEEFHVWNVTLKKITEWYNKMRLRAKPQEFELVSEEITLMDFQINKINKENKWESSSNWDQIKELHDMVWQLTDRMNKAQDNLQSILQLSNQWNFYPLYNRAKGKKGELLVYLDLHDVRQRFKAIIEAGQTIYSLMDRNFHLLNNIPLPRQDADGNEEVDDESKKESNADDTEGDAAEESGSEPDDEDENNEFEDEESGIEDDEGNVGDEIKEINIEGMADEGPSIVTEDTGTQLTGSTSDDDSQTGDRSWFCFAPNDSGSESNDEENFDKNPNEQPRTIAFKIHERWLADQTRFSENLSGEPLVPSHPATMKKSRKDRRKEMDKNRLHLLATRRDTSTTNNASFSQSNWKETKNAEGGKSHHSNEDSDSGNNKFSASEGIFQDAKSVQEESYQLEVQAIQANQMKRENWVKYLNMIDDMVFEGLLHATGAAFSFLIEQMEPASQNGPLFEVKMKLIEPDIIFEPAMSANSDSSSSIISTITKIMGDIDVMPLLIPRISHLQKNTSYMDDVLSHEDIEAMKAEIIEKTQTAIQETENFVKPYYKYSYLWLENQSEHLSQFLRYSRLLTAEDLELESRTDEDGNALLPPSPPTIDDFRKMIDSYDDLFKEISDMANDMMITSWIRIDLRSFKTKLLNICSHWAMLYKQHLIDDIVAKLQELDQFIEEALVELNKPLIKGDYDGLVNIMGYLLQIKQRQDETDNMFDPLREVIALLKSYGLDLSDQVYTLLGEMPDRWLNLKRLATQVRIMAQPLMQEESNTIRRRLNFFDVRQNLFKTRFRQKDFFNWDCDNPYWSIDEAHNEVIALEDMCGKLAEQASLFEVMVPEFKVLKQTRKDTKLIKVLWDYILVVRSWIYEWECTEWKKIDSESMDMELKKFAKEMRTMDKDMRYWDLYLKLESIIKNMITALRAITELQNPAIRDRHWKQLMQATKVMFIIGQNTTLKDLLDLNLYKYEDEVKTIVDKSVKEMSMEKTLTELNNIWSTMEFEYELHTRSGLKVLKVSEEIIETLEENQVQLQNMLSSKFISHFLDDVSEWQKKLSNSDQVIHTWIEVQRTWMYLESIFVGSDDIRRQLPDDSRIFDHVDKEFKEMLGDIADIPNVIAATSLPRQQERLEALQKDLTKCEKALAQYLETKRLAYPRFYFVSSADLLDILSNGNQPLLVCRHLTKLYDSIAKLKFNEIDGKDTRTAVGMRAKDGEFVRFNLPCDCTGQVEKWLNTVTDVMRKSGRHYFQLAVNTYDDKPREQWVFDFPAQPALCGTQIWWAAEVTVAFAKLEEGYENALKDYQKKQILQLNQLINLLLGDLSDGDRQKVTTICTVDVHSRDVVTKLIATKVETSLAFQWQSQLRHRWDQDLQDCYVNICDAEFLYDYEYLGNTPRLVITPLTDRCYITLTQSLHLVMGGAPAGPAGTGKTETTKDLGKGLGIMVYVFNCSEQMDYKSCGNIYKGLSQTGAWGCFDEFNRISVDVLSVVAVQVKSVLDAIKKKKQKFSFQGETISLVPTVGMFITMNPGYAGRAELPENLKALFRPCAMVVPDFELICEIMLIGEGFQEARVLGKKFLTLYSLCKELLSKQDHYDWGLRAIKSVLVVAGKLKGPIVTTAMTPECMKS